MNRCAVIDLGTNTFHLLVMEWGSDVPPRELYRERIHIRLAEDGIRKIGPAPFQRAMDALAKYRQVLDEYGVQQVRALGTAAMRTASNGPDLVAQARDRYGISIELISGQEEARLIHLGVLQAIPALGERMVIMDIGGGSVEFIIADGSGVVWSESYPVGASVLHHRFHKKDPIGLDEREALCQYLQETLAGFLAAMQQYQATVLVGSSGTFDVMEAIMEKRWQYSRSSELSLADFQPMYKSLMNSTLAERRNMKGIPEERADMIVVAMELVHFVLQHTAIRRVLVSSYALKEGLLEEMIAG